MPSPISSMGTKTISAPASGSSPASRTTVPASSASSPQRTMRRGDTVGSSRGTPIAATSNVTESGRSRAPVASAERPRQTDRKSGTTKKRPACIRYWKKNMTRPPLSCLLRSIAVRTSGSFPCASRRLSHRKKIQITRRPARISQVVGDTLNQDGPSGFGCTHPHSLERSTPKTSSPRPRAEITAPTTSSFGRSSDGASAMRRVSTRIASTTTTSPANTQRQEK